MFKGSIVALVTPMKNGLIDHDAISHLVEKHINDGTRAIVAAGTTGESGTLSHDEKLAVINTVIKAANERIPVIAGTAMNNTQECVDLTKKAMDLGAHAALIMTPAYIKPPQEGLFLHYAHIAKSVPLPIILYNVPSRTACDLLPETIERLGDFSNIIGIKEATADIERLKAIKKISSNFDIYSGDDCTACEWMLNGAKGVISVTANIAAKLMAKLSDAAFDKDNTLASSIDKKLAKLHKLLFCESNPIPVKWALYKQNLISNEIRLPLLPLNAKYQAELENELRNLDLIN